MADAKLIHNLIAYLEAQRRAGREYVHLSEANRRFLNELVQDAHRPPPLPPPVTVPSSRSVPREVSLPNPELSETAPVYLAAASDLDLSQATWEDLERLVPPCTRCQLCRAGRRQTVLDDGDRHAGLMFIGEGPGADEDRQGVPFVGEAGKLLTKIIQAMGFRRSEVYIANIVKCRPPNNRNPEPPEAEACLPYLLRQIELVQPKVIVTLGAVPLQFLLNRKGITRSRGHWLKFRAIDVMPTFHPAFLMRKPEAKREVWEDMKQVMARFGKTPPDSASRPCP